VIMKAKIISDGTLQGTHVFGTDGEELKLPISKITWEIEAAGCASKAAIEVQLIDIEAIGTIRKDE
jgi:hypothetical protein